MSCVPAIQSRAKTSSSTGEDEPNGLPFIWESLQNQEFQNSQLKSSLVPGEMGLRNIIKFISNDSEAFVVQRKLIY